MSLFAIGDTHLSFGCDKPMDIFHRWHNHIERLEKNWRAVVTDNDTVVIPGDISWAMSMEDAVPDFKFLDSLPGHKLIMKGNHDYWWSTMNKLVKCFEQEGITTIEMVFNNAFRVGDFCVCGTRGWFYDAHGEADMKVLMREVGRLKMSINVARALGGEPLVFLHYPPLTHEAVCEEIVNTLHEEGIKRCWYGHLHSESADYAFTGERDGIKYGLVSCDYLDFCPKLLEKF